MILRAMFEKLLRMCFVVVCLICLGTGRPSGIVYIKGRAYRSLSNITASFRMSGRRSDKIIRYTGRGRSLQVELSNRRISWNGRRVLLGYPVVMHRNHVLVSDSDWRSTLSSLFYPRSVPQHRLRYITLDAGHGGNDRGASGRISHEKNITLRLTRRVAAILRNCGFRVHLTRYRDVAVPLKQRSAMQRAARSDLFVSIHVNAAANKKVSGIETFCLTPADAPSSHGKFELKRNPANRFDRSNFMLAWRIQNAMCQRTGAVDRGVKRARFAVLRDISAPGVLVEIGFISHPREEQNLNNAMYLERIARGIAQGIIAYQYDIYRRKR